MSTAPVPGVLTGQVLAGIDAALASPSGPDRLDVEVCLLLLADHPGTTAGMWRRVRARLDDAVEALALEDAEVGEAARGLEGPMALLRHRFGLGRRRREWEDRAMALVQRAEGLHELLALVRLLEAERPTLAAG